MAKMVPKIVKRAGTLNRHLRVRNLRALTFHMTDNDHFYKIKLRVLLEVGFY